MYVDKEMKKKLTCETSLEECHETEKAGRLVAVAGRA